MGSYGRMLVLMRIVTKYEVGVLLGKRVTISS